MTEQKDWRKMLEEVGGYKNGFTPVHAFAVREMIDEIESLREELKKSTTTLGDMLSAQYRLEVELQRLRAENANLQAKLDAHEAQSPTNEQQTEFSLRRVLALASEFCDALDRAEEDIGGSRPIGDILKELGPAVDAAEEQP